MSTIEAPAAESVGCAAGGPGSAGDLSGRLLDLVNKQWTAAAIERAKDDPRLWRWRKMHRRRNCRLGAWPGPVGTSHRFQHHRQVTRRRTVSGQRSGADVGQTKQISA